MASQCTAKSLLEASGFGESSHGEQGNPNDYTKDRGKMPSALPLGNPEATNANPQPLNQFPAFPYSYPGPFYGGAQDPYGSHPMMHSQIVDMAQSQHVPLPSESATDAQDPYGSHPVMHSQIVDMDMAHSERVPLRPSESATDEPIYVNPKQYHAILRRRQLRKTLESGDKLVKVRKRIVNESRQNHANKRPRGEGGRFLNTKQQSGPSGATELGLAPACPSVPLTGSNHASMFTGGRMEGGNGVNGGPQQYYFPNMR